MRATPEMVDRCSGSNSSTLAWYSGDLHPVEIRQGSIAGPALARFDTISGLLDVYPSASETYELVGYSAGQWQPLASARVQVASAACRP